MLHPLHGLDQTHSMDDSGNVRPNKDDSNVYVMTLVVNVIRHSVPKMHGLAVCIPVQVEETKAIVANEHSGVVPAAHNSPAKKSLKILVAGTCECGWRRHSWLVLKSMTNFTILVAWSCTLQIINN